MLVLLLRLILAERWIFVLIDEERSKVLITWSFASSAYWLVDGCSHSPRLLAPEYDGNLDQIYIIIWFGSTLRMNIPCKVGTKLYQSCSESKQVESY